MKSRPEPGLRLVYSPRYDIRFFGIERLHPFDSRKYSRAWKLLSDWFGHGLHAITEAPAAPVDDAALLRVHHAGYLKQIRSSKYLEQALELPNLRYFPGWLLRRAILRPMRWGVAGTILAARAALETGAAVNLSGGYHHASADRGEGFCIYSDVPVAIAALRAEGRIAAGDRIGLIDLDAHQGNGFERALAGDRDIVILDIYNGAIYPQDDDARRRIDIDVPLRRGVEDGEYLDAVREGLDSLLSRLGQPRLVFFNAGTDVLRTDPLGGLRVSAAGIQRRDELVFQALLERGIPFVFVPSGGYTQSSYVLIAQSAAWLVRRLTSLTPRADTSNSE